MWREVLSNHLCMEVMQREEEAFLSFASCQAAVGVGTLSPHCFGSGSSSSSYPVPARLQRQVGQKATPASLQVANMPREKARPDPAAHLGTPMALGCGERLPGSVPCTPSLLHPATATPYSHHSVVMKVWARTAEKSSFAFIKITVPLFPLEAISYLLTVVKYCCSSPSNQAGFPLCSRYPPHFFKSWKEWSLFLFVCRCTVHCFNAAKWRIKCERAPK